MNKEQLMSVMRDALGSIASPTGDDEKVEGNSFYIRGQINTVLTIWESLSNHDIILTSTPTPQSDPSLPDPSFQQMLGKNKHAQEILKERTMSSMSKSREAAEQQMGRHLGNVEMLAETAKVIERYSSVLLEVQKVVSGTLNKVESVEERLSKFEGSVGSNIDLTAKLAGCVNGVLSSVSCLLKKKSEKHKRKFKAGNSFDHRNVVIEKILEDVIRGGNSERLSDIWKQNMDKFHPNHGLFYLFSKRVLQICQGRNLCPVFCASDRRDLLEQTKNVKDSEVILWKMPFEVCEKWYGAKFRRNEWFFSKKENIVEDSDVLSYSSEDMFESESDTENSKVVVTNESAPEQ